MDINLIMDELGNEVESQAPLKEKAATAVRLFQEAADKKGIVLKLRKK